MTPAIRNVRLHNGVKIIGLLAVGLSFLMVLSCYSGTSSSTSSSGSSGTGTGWNITITIGTNPIPLDGETQIMAIVRDRAGALAPSGTIVCMTAIRGDFLKPGDPTGYATICDSISNNYGQSVQTYRGTEKGDDTIQISSQNALTTATISVF